MSQPQAAPEVGAQPELDHKQMADAIRVLSMDAIKKANSGHTGMPMGMADIATVLYTKFFKFDPANPRWFNRDRLIISNGHGSMLPYSLSYLTGNKKITLEEIKNFRQLGSHTPGHPEVDFDAAIETTTGPLGQGISNAVGFAIAERVLNKKHGDNLNHFTYVFVGDGCLMEGVSHEACSLAGHLKLNKLIALYDDNNVTIDGTIDIAFTEDVKARFAAYGWDIQEIDGHDPAAIEAAIAHAQTTDKPSFIACKTKIGFGTPTFESQPKAHGAITGDDEIAGTRENLKWPYAPFEVPEDVLAMWRSLGVRGTTSDMPKIDMSDIDTAIAKLKADFAEQKPNKATRQTSGACLEELVPTLGCMVGGSADLTGSNNTKVSDSVVITSDNFDGNYINYGVREHGMAAIMNGIALHGGLVPYAGTFMQFADYSRPSIRLAALMEQRVIHVMTHDSIGLGEDGPTHQPVEHLSSLRAIPNCYVYRPCDGVETAECWELALKKEDAPAILALTRQGVPTVREDDPVNKSSLGAYILEDCEGDEPDVTIFASGSEVHLALEAAEELDENVRVVSVPCMDLFWEQDGEYIQSLLCNKSYKIAIEAGVRQSWDRIIGGHGTFIGMSTFGASAPADVLYEHFGITSKAIVEAVKNKN